MADRHWSMGGGLPPLRPGSRPRARLFPDNPETPGLSKERPQVHPRPRPPPVGSCNHTMMAVIHSDTEECSKCGCPSPIARLYRCTVDKEVEIIEAKEHGDEVTSDKVGEIFEDAMTLGKFGPDARSRENSLLNEMTPEQLASYTPEQLKILLAHRAHVHKKIAEARGPDYLAQPFPARRNYPDDDKPWVAAEKLRCRHQVCASCDRHAKEKTWASLDGVLNGDILPTLAVGLSLDGYPFREPADANVVKNLGFRAVPLSRDHPARPPTPLATDGHKPRSSCIDGLDQDDGVATSDRAAFYMAGGATIFDHDAAGGLTAVPRTMPSLTLDGDDYDDEATATAAATLISVDEFILEYEYSEYTLACCTPLPAADETEARFLSGERLAGRRAAGDGGGDGGGDRDGDEDGDGGNDGDGDGDGDDATLISVDDFILEYEYSEHTLACCTPLPKADEKEKCFFSGEKRAGRRDGGAVVGVGGDEGFGLTEEAAEQGVSDVKFPVVTAISCDDNWV